MSEKKPFHIIHESPRIRAAIARAALATGHHAEVYSDLWELIARAPREGVLLLSDEAGGARLEQNLARLEKAGSQLPFVSMAQDISADRIVAAMKAGALDYLHIPPSLELPSEAFEQIQAEASTRGERYRKIFDAKRRLAGLTERERQVLHLLAKGGTSKAIARDLEISPRTVEIYRASLLTKLGVGSAAEAVNVSLEASLAPSSIANSGVFDKYT